MKIVGIHIDGFGHFADTNLGPFDSPVTVIEGVNEAGKSTLLAFVRTMLFGWPAQKRGEFYRPLAGGRHGGRIDLATDNGVYSVERWEDGRGQHFQLRKPDGTEESNEGALQQILGHASGDLFREVFAFDLDVLRGLSDSASKDVFAAGMGARALPDALKAIDRQRADLFRKGGSKQEIAKVLHQLSVVRSELEKGSRDAEEYGRLTQRAAELESELLSIGDEVEAARAAERESTQLLQGWKPWVRISELDAVLETLPAGTGFPHDGVAQLKNAEDLIARDDRQLQRAEQDLRECRERLDGIHVDSVVLDASAAIDDLKERLGAYRQSLTDLPKRVAETEEKRASLDEALRNLGPGWDATRVTEFDTSVPTRHEVDGIKTAIEVAEKAVGTARSDRDHAAATLAGAVETADKAAADVEAAREGAIDRATLEAQREGIRSYRTRAEAHRDAEAERKQLEWQLAALPAPVAPAPRQIGWLRWVATITLAFVGLSAIAPAASGSVAGAVATIVVEAIVAALLYLMWRRPQDDRQVKTNVHPLAQQLADAREHEQATGAALEEIAGQLRLDSAGHADLDEMEDRLRDAEEALARLEGKESAAVTAHEAMERATRQNEAAADALAQAEQAHEDAISAWEAWLVRRQLPKGYNAGLATQLLDRIDHARTLVNNLNAPGGHVHRQQAIEKDIAAYDRDVRAVCERLQRPQPESGPATIALVNTLVAEQKGAAEAAADRKNAQQAVEAGERALATATEEARASKERLAALLEQGGVSTAEAFRERADALAERHKVEAERSQYVTQLTTLSGPGDAFERFRARLAASTYAEIETAADVARQRLKDTETHRDELLNEAARIRERLSLMTDGTKTSNLLAQRESLKQELVELARKWSQLTIARAILERARKRWEEERQPGVVHDAQEFFSTITGGRYSRVLPQIETNVLKVEEATSKRQKETGELSRGTLEQLYLSLRFGLIRQFGERETRLPVIVDEVLVNFDAKRGARVAEAFARLSATNQVLVFTCHAWVSDLFRSGGPCEVVKLDTGKGTGQPQPAMLLGAE